VDDGVELLEPRDQLKEGEVQVQKELLLFLEMVPQLALIDVQSLQTLLHGREYELIELPKYISSLRRMLLLCLLLRQELHFFLMIEQLDVFLRSQVQGLIRNQALLKTIKIQCLFYSLLLEFV
jgi:hypothetical protein